MDVNGIKPELTKTSSSDDSWVIVRAGDSLFAVPALSVQTMVMLPEVIAMPRASSFVRGVVNLRGSVLPVVDLRVRSGMEPLYKHTEELCALLDAREKDHCNWMEELNNSIVEKRAFTLTTDPHRCAFGKWYDNYQTDDLVFGMLLRKFDEPHRAIHAIGHKVETLKANNQWDEAIELIENTRATTLSVLIELFASAKAHLRSSIREIAVVIEGNGAPFALAVDNVESAEHLDAASISNMSEIMAVNQSCGLVRGVAKRKKDQQMVLLLDTDTLLTEVQGATAQAA